MSECLPPAFSTCVWKGEGKETLHAVLSRVQTELPIQFLAVCTLCSLQLIYEKLHRSCKVQMTTVVTVMLLSL